MLDRTVERQSEKRDDVFALVECRHDDRQMRLTRVVGNVHSRKRKWPNSRLALKRERESAAA
jgi:hypothetical protein